MEISSMSSFDPSLDQVLKFLHDSEYTVDVRVMPFDCMSYSFDLGTTWKHFTNFRNMARELAIAAIEDDPNSVFARDYGHHYQTETRA